MRRGNASIDTAAASGVPQLAEVRGRLGVAEQLDALFETDRSVPEIRRVLALAPARPVGGVARAQLLLGRMLDRLGQRDEAVAAYRAAAAAPVPDGDPDRIGPQARRGLSRAPDPGSAQGYRVSLAGWRAFERNDLSTAAAELSRARTLAPTDAMIRVRLARVTARTHADRALAEFDAVIAARPQVAPVALNAAYLWSAELLEARGARAQALDRYRAATRVFAGDSRMAAVARKALARLGELNNVCVCRVRCRKLVRARRRTKVGVPKSKGGTDAPLSIARQRCYRFFAAFLAVFLAFFAIADPPFLGVGCASDRTASGLDRWPPGPRDRPARCLPLRDHLCASLAADLPGGELNEDVT